MTTKAIYLASDLPDTPTVLADGTMWSHVATLGTRIKNTTFTIDRSTIDNMVKVFLTGYPRKVCVDYEHGTANGATDHGQPVPAAGQVKELKGVYSVADFSGELRATAEKLAAKVSRPLDDPRNMGLWMRWYPTARALTMVTSREYTELSICFAHDYQHNETGEPQGPTILSVALTNSPFLDDMLPVAASRRDGGSPLDKSQQEQENMPNATLLQRASAFFGKVFATEEEVQVAAEDRITALTRENAELKAQKPFFDVVSAEVGETDPTKAKAKVVELKAVAATAQREKEEETKRANKVVCDAILLKHEKRLTPALKAVFEPQIMTELSAGVKKDETKTEKAIESLPINPNLGRKSAADGGSDLPTDLDSRVAARAESLMEENPRLKKLAEKNPGEAYKESIRVAARELMTTSR